MSLQQIRRGHVLKAIAECNRLGEDEFLAKYGFSNTKSFLLRRGHQFYPSKAIVGVAHGFATGNFWRATDFSGGEATVANLLEGKLGFEMVRQPYDRWPFWTRLGNAAGSLAKQFTPWVPWSKRETRLDDHLPFPGVYMIAQGRSRPRSTCPPPSSVIYIGETTRRTLLARLREFEASALGGSGHSGGVTFYENKKGKLDRLFVTVLPVRLPRSEQNAAISTLERYLIWQYATNWRALPVCNSK